LLSAVVVSSIGNGMILPFTIIFLTRYFHVSLAAAGTTVAIANLVAMAAGVLFGALIDRWSAVAVLVAGAAIQVVALTCFALTTNRVAAVLALVLNAVGQGSGYPSRSSLFASLVAGRSRSRLFGLSFLLANLGSGVGSLLAAVIVRGGTRASFTTLYLLDALSFAALLSVTLLAARHPSVPGGVRRASYRSDTSSGSYREAFRLPVYRLLFVLSFLLTFSSTGVLEYGIPAAAVANSRLGTSTVAVVFLVNCAVIVAGQSVLLPVLLGRRQLVNLRLACLICVLATVALVLTGSPALAGLAAVLLVSVGALVAFAEIVLSPVLAPLANDAAPEHLRGRFNAALSTSFGLAYIVAPVVATVLLGSHLGWLYLLLILACCAAAAAIAPRVVRLAVPAVAGRDLSSEANLA